MEGDYDRGTYYLALGWALTIIAIITVGFRLYSRSQITRSLGSDDATVVISLILSLVGESFNSIEVRNGLGRHRDYLTNAQFQTIEKWEYISWIVVFISFFFLRASVMLFVLRLLPPNKNWQKRCILGLFFLNFATAMIALVTFGIKCIPFHDIWKEELPNRKCLPARVNTAAFYVNGILACVVDICTAIIPEALLWNVPMKRKTKIQLNMIFGAGLVTAGLSIGRVAAINNGVWQTDNTWRIIPSDTFSLVEEKLGIICASLPALRQLYAYRKRLRTTLPTQSRQPPNEDFSKMRRKVHLRDIFWYHRHSSVAAAERAGAQHQLVFAPKEGETVEQARVRQTRNGSRPENSVLDSWEHKFWNWLFARRDRRRALQEQQLAAYDLPSGYTSERNPSDQSTWSYKNPMDEKAKNNGSWWSLHRIMSRSGKKDNLKSINSAQEARMDMSAERGQGWPGLGSQPGHRHLNYSYKNWGLLHNSGLDKARRGEEDAVPSAGHKDPPIVVPHRPSKAPGRGAGDLLRKSSVAQSEKTIKAKPRRDGNVTPKLDDRHNFLDSRTTAIQGSPTGNMSQARDEWELDEPSPMTKLDENGHEEGWDLKTGIKD